MKKSAVAAAVGLALAVQFESARALPEGGQVTAGQGSIGAPANGALVIKQDSQRLALDWLKFGIGAGESVHFAQPGASAIALNRVVGNDPSAIYGRLSATGQVFLLNPNGVLFAPGAQVNVGGLVASTLKLSNEDFLAGRYVFSKGDKAGSVVNQGEITAGYAALLGPQVINQGIITATLGTVALAAGEQITLNLNGTSLVGLTVDKGALDALTANKQLIRADGGTVILTAKATDDVLRNVVNNDGIIEARTISARDGVIRLESTGSGITAVNGSLEAKNIIVTGDKVGLFDGARLEAASGEILVGGNFQGKGPERNSTATYVAPGATLTADAAGEGDGGRVIVWSDGVTRFYGHASARGGAHGGDGGFIEVSGKRQLVYRGSVDVGAPNGRAGSVLFDPHNILIADLGADVVANNDEFAENPGTDVTFDADSITAITNTGAAVTLRANNDISIGEPIITNNPGGNGGAITLQAGRAIFFFGNANVTTDNGNLTLIANESVANGVVDAQRDGGGASIQMSGMSVNAGTGSVNITIRAGDDKTNHDSGEIQLGPITAATLTVTHAGVPFGAHNIRQSGALIISGTASFDAGDGLIELGSGTNDFQGTVNLASTGGHPHSIWDGNDLRLGNVSLATFGGTLLIETGTNGGATGDVTQTGPMTAESVTVFTFAPVSDIKLDQANQITDTANPYRLQNIGLGTWRDVSLRNDATGPAWRLNFNGLWPTIGRDLTIRSATEIRQDQRIIVVGAATFNAGSNFIRLDHGFNDFQGPVNLTSSAFGSGAEVHDANDIQLGTVTFDPLASLFLQIGTGGAVPTTHVTQTGAITAGHVQINFFGGALADVVLDQANMLSDTTNPIRLDNFGSTIWRNVSLRNEYGLGPWSLNHTNSWPTITGNLTVRSVNGIVQANPITVAGDATFNSDQRVFLDGRLNDFQGVVNLTSGGFTTSQISDANNLTLGTITFTDPFSDLFVETGGAGTFGTLVTGNLTQTVPLSMPQLRVSTLSITTSDIVLDQANMMTNTTDPFQISNNNSFAGGMWGNVSLRNEWAAGTWNLNDTNGWGAIGGNLTIRSINPIGQTHPISVAGSATFNSNGRIVLDSTANDFQGVVNLTSPLGSVTHQITAGGNLQLGTMDLAPATSSLFVQTGGDGVSTGNLTQTVPLNMPQLRVETLGATTSEIVLDLANMMSNTTDPFHLENTGAGAWGNVNLRNDWGAGSWSLNTGNLWAAIGGNLTIRTVTGIDQANAITVVGTSHLETASGNIQLTANNDFQDTVTLVGGTNVHLRQGSVHDLKVAPRTAQRLTLVSANSGIDLSAGTYASSGDVLTLNANTNTELISGPVTFSGTAGISITGDVIGPGALVMNQTGVGQSITAGGSLGTLASPLASLTIDNDGTSPLNLVSGLISVSGALNVTTAGALNFGETRVGGVSNIAANGNILLTSSSNDFQGLVTLTGGADVDIRQGSGNSLRLAPLSAERLQATSFSSNLLLFPGTYASTVDFVALNAPTTEITSGSVTLSGAAGLTINSDVIGPGALVLQQNGIGQSIAAGGSLGTLASPLASLTIDNDGTSPLNLVSGLISVSGALNVTTAGALNFGETRVGGVSNIGAHGNILLTSSSNDFQGLVTLTGGTDVDIRQGSGHSLRLAPLSAERLQATSFSSNLLLFPGTYTSTVDFVALNAPTTEITSGTATLSGAAGLSINGDVIGPGALVLQQNGIGQSITTGGSLGTLASPLASLTIDNDGTLALNIAGTGPISVSGALNVTTAGALNFGETRVGGVSNIAANGNILLTSSSNDFQGLVTLTGGADVDIRQGSGHSLRLAPLSAERLQATSFSSNLLLFPGTYASTVDFVALNAPTTEITSGTATLSGAAGLSINSDVIGPGSLVLQQNGIGQNIALGGSLGSALTPLASLGISDAGTLGFSLRSVNAGNAVSVETAGTLTLPASAVIASGAAGNAIVLATGGDFVNNSGAGALSAPSGRWLVYSTSPAGSTEGGLTAAAGSAMPRLYNRTFAANGPATITQPGNHLIYSAQPSLPVAADNLSRPVGAPNPPFTFSVGGYLTDDGVTDSVTSAGFSGALTTSALLGSPAGLYPITQGTLASGAGYGLSFTAGALTLTAPVAPVILAAPPPPVAIEPLRAYVDTLSAIQGNRVAAATPTEHGRMVTIENGGIRLPEGLKP